MTIVVDCMYCSVELKRKIMRAVIKAFNKPVSDYCLSLEHTRSFVNFDDSNIISVYSYVPSTLRGNYYYAKTFINLGSL